VAKALMKERLTRRKGWGAGTVRLRQRAIAAPDGKRNRLRPVTSNHRQRHNGRCLGHWRVAGQAATVRWTSSFYVSLRFIFPSGHRRPSRTAVRPVTPPGRRRGPPEHAVPLFADELLRAADSQVPKRLYWRSSVASRESKEGSPADVQGVPRDAGSTPTALRLARRP